MRTSPLESLNERALCAVVEGVLERLDREARFIGVEARGPWRGPPSVAVGGRSFRVVPAASALELREALLQAEEDQSPTIILSALSTNEVGGDVLARLARGRVFSPHPWETLRGLFRASRIDAAGIGTSLLRALIDHAPPGGYAPVPAGILDATAAWNALLEHHLRLPSAGLDLATLLRWASSKDGQRRYRELASTPELLAATQERLVKVLREPGESVLKLLSAVVNSTHGQGTAPGPPSPLATAAACEVLFSREIDPATARPAIIRLERFHGESPITEEVGRPLGEAARECARDLVDLKQVDELLGHLDQADALLERLGAGAFIHLSSLTRLGFKCRVARFGESLSDALGLLGKATFPAALEESEARAGTVAAHRLAPEGDSPLAAAAGDAGAINRTRMAVRLLRWLGREESRDTGRPASLAVEADWYVRETSWVDFAREVLTVGDPVKEASSAYLLLDQAVEARRRETSQRFANALAGWLETGGDTGAVVPVENVLSRIVVPLVEARCPVLLIVIDGMSWAVAREVLADPHALRWAELCLPEGAGSELSALATVPSVTEYSRTSLLSGELCRGAAADEARAFASHAGLLAAIGKGPPPALFHKSTLTEGSRGPLTEDVRRQIADARERVLGVVINAVDERLANAQQERSRWRIDTIHPLPSLLEAAWEADRVVIIASDHGHVLHRDGDGTPFPDAGERWRPAVGAPRKGEVVLRGTRVLADGEPASGGARSVIVPWDASTRYGGFKNGYHGGAAPEEMLAPLLVLARRGRPLEGFIPHVPVRPEWWQAPLQGKTTLAHTEEAASTTPPVAAKSSTDYPGVADLPIFKSIIESAAKTSSPVARDSWIAALMQSGVFLAQKELVKRHLPSEEDVRKVLEVLHRQGGSMTRAAFAVKVGVDPPRVDGFLAKVARLLNIDGYEILKLDRERDVVTLQEDLLLTQFEIETVAGPEKFAPEQDSATHRRET